MRRVYISSTRDHKLVVGTVERRGYSECDCRDCRRVVGSRIE
jgi:hypothetical protein